MNWNIAQAKQHFSQVVKQAGNEPQLIYNRDTPVAAVIAAEELAEYQVWKQQQAPSRTLADEFAELRRIMQEEGRGGLEIPERRDRPNALVDMFVEEGLLDSGKP